MDECPEGAGALAATKGPGMDPCVGHTSAVQVLWTLAGRRWHLIWEGMGNVRCLFQQELGVGVWEGEPGSRGQSDSPG